MEKINEHTGIGVPLRRSNVDTDQIIPAVYLKRVTKTGYDDALFAQWRRDPEFILNHEAYANGTILVAGPDFGTGSSREHAVWALRDYGFRVILAPKFADIFRGNAGKQGLLTGIITQEDCEKLWEILENNPGTCLTVSLEKTTVQAGTYTCQFDIDNYTRWRLLEGLDDIALTLREEDHITAFEKERPAYKPATLPAKHLPQETVVSARESMTETSTPSHATQQ